MNNKTIIEFAFRMIRRIMLISEDVIHIGQDSILLDLQNSSHHTQPLSITVKYTFNNMEIKLVLNSLV